MIKQIFSLLYLLIRAYSFIIFIRILFSWFNINGNSYGKTQSQLISYLYKLTDPYLNWFRRFNFLRVGVLDFSAMLGIVLLYFVGDIFRNIASRGSIDLMHILSLLIGTIWVFISSVIFVLIVILIIRVIFIQLNKHSQLFYSLDGYIEPHVRKFSNLFSKKFTPYKTNLIILIATLIIIQLAGGWIFGLIGGLLR